MAAKSQSEGPCVDLPSVRRRLERTAARRREESYAAMIRADAPHLHGTRHTPILLIFARLVLTSRHLADQIDQLGVVDTENEPRSALIGNYTRVANVTLKYAQELGLTPNAMSKLGLAGKSKLVFDLNAYRNGEVEEVVEADGEEPTS